MSKALYFPYIQVPAAPWFTRVLLYWDEVAAIVPMDYWNEPEQLGSHMNALMREQLVRPIAPGRYIDSLQDFTSSFVAYVKDRRASSVPAPKKRWVRIHIEKLGEVGNELCQLGLAQQGQYPWYLVEPHVARAFMIYLVGVLRSSGGDQQFDPVTYRQTYLGMFQPKRMETNSPDDTRLLLLRNILPAPAGAVNAGDLRDFKEKNRAALKAFRRRIEDVTSEVSVIPDPAGRAARMSYLIKQMQDDVADIQERLRKSRWVRFETGTLCTLVGGALSLSGGIATGNKFAQAAGGMSILAAITNATRAARVNDPLAYAALAGRHFS